MDREKLLASVYRVAVAHVILHLNFNLGNLNVLPDWLGYGMIVGALAGLAQEEPSAELLRPLGHILVGWSLVIWCAALAGTNLKGYAMSYIVAVVQLYFRFQLLTDIAAVAAKYAPQYERRILQLRTVMTVVVTVYVLSTAFTVHKSVETAVAVVYVAAALWLVRTLMRMHDQMEEAFGLKTETLPTFAERVQMNNKNAED